MLCLNCQKYEAIKHPYFGYLPCKDCQERGKKTGSRNKQVEFTTDEIKEQRKAYKGDIYQPYRHGEVSREYLVAQKKAGRPHNLDITPEEEAKATNVWDIEGYYKDE